MRIYVDGDGCPRAVKDIVFRVAERRSVEVVLVANHPVAVPRHPKIRAVQVPKGLDVADEWLVRTSESGDLVITSDVPLAAELVERGVEAINARGEMYTRETVREKLALRDFFTEARESGMIAGGGPPPYDEKAARKFANAFDTWLTKALRRSPPA